MRDARAACPRGARDRRRGDRRRQRLRGPERRARRRRGCDGRARASARLRERVPRRLRGRQGQVHRDDRRRPHLRLRGDPELRPATRRGRRARDGESDGQHRAGSDVAHEPHREPDPLRFPERRLPDADRRRPLRVPRDSAGRAHPPRPPLDRDGVRVGDGDPRGPGGARHPGAADRPPRPRRRVEALAAPGRLAAPPAHARVQPRVPLPRPRRRHGRPRADHDRHRAGEA